MFNVYYINYAKAFEIAMQMDNKILEQTIKEHGWEAGGNASVSVDDKEVTNSLLSKILPKTAQLNNIRLITREIELCVASIVEEKLGNR